MNLDEGYIKFKAYWDKTSPFANEVIQELNAWRQRLYDVNLLGAYPDGIGFGNVSLRKTGNQFYISGSTTGNFKTLTNEHYALVTDFDLDQNEVHCSGPIIASSESPSHASLYQSVPEVNAVFHVHHFELWKKTLDEIPTTDKSAPYGCPEMSHEIMRLIKESDVLEHKVFAMGGHREGLIAFGRTLDEAGETILSLLKKYLD